MITGFLHNDSLTGSSGETLNTGFAYLNDIVLFSKRQKNSHSRQICSLLKNSYDVWNTLYSELWSHLAPEIQRILPQILEQGFVNTESSFSNIGDFNREYSETSNCFIGIDFSRLDLEAGCYTSNCDEFSLFLKNSLETRDVSDKEEQLEILKILYPEYRFEPQAVEDAFYWSIHNKSLYKKLHLLLFDILTNPFTGGEGQTEILKHTGECSKRLDRANRITYLYKTNIVTVMSCKGHYE